MRALGVRERKRNRRVRAHRSGGGDDANGRPKRAGNVGLVQGPIVSPAAAAAAKLCHAIGGGDDDNATIPRTWLIFSPSIQGGCRQI